MRLVCKEIDNFLWPLSETTETGTFSTLSYYKNKSI
jgi:hypothetical protein